MKKHFYAGLMMATGLWLFSACGGKKGTAINEAEVLHNNQDQLTQIIIYDVFTPPVSSRIYVYSSLASYEAIRFAKPGTASITAKLNGFKPMPEPEKNKSYNYALAATQAFFTVVHKVVFSLDSLKAYEKATMDKFRSSMDEETFKRSVAFGDTIARTVLARAASDGYALSR
ncbi:MAG: phosphoesterase, partial [Chitinophagaceae bacterium]|nr:phosphoesterase [Chitinophagaceae bacterium]